MLLALCALALGLAGFFLPLYFALPSLLLGAMDILMRVFIAGAIGWAVTTVVDALIKRRLSHLKMDQPDDLTARKLATRLDVTPFAYGS